MAPDDYLVMTSKEWAGLRANTPLTLSEEDLAALRGVNEDISLEDVVNIYLPLSRLINLHVSAARNLASIKDTFLGRPAKNRPMSWRLRAVWPSAKAPLPVSCRR